MALTLSEAIRLEVELHRQRHGNLSYISVRRSFGIWLAIRPLQAPSIQLFNTAGTLNIGSGVNTTLRLGSSDFSQAFWSNNQSWLVFSGANRRKWFFDTGLINVDTTGSINVHWLVTGLGRELETKSS